MARLLGLDIGEKRTGMALTDELQLISSPLETVATPSLLSRIQAVNQESPLEAIVVGMPNWMTQKQTDSSEFIRSMVDTIRTTFPHLTIHLVDENNTSAEASAIQIQGGMKRSKRSQKGSLDAIAASLILQRHLDSRPYR